MSVGTTMAFGSRAAPFAAMTMAAGSAGGAAEAIIEQRGAGDRLSTPMSISIRSSPWT